MKYGRQSNRCTASWMAILALTTLTGCHVTHPLHVKEAPCPPPVYMEYPYFGYHPTCWARWPADWVGCPPEGCPPVMEGYNAEFVPLPEGAPVPPRPVSPEKESDALPPVSPPATPPETEAELPPALPNRDISPSLPEEDDKRPELPPAPVPAPAPAATPQSLRIRLHAPSQSTMRDARTPPPQRTSLNTYTSMPTVAAHRPEPRRVYGLARMARHDVVRRSRTTSPMPPSIQELVGNERDDQLRFDSSDEVLPAYPTASARY